VTATDDRAQEFALRQQTETLAETMRQEPERWGSLSGFQRILTAGHLLRCQQLYASGHLTEFPEKQEGR
jgi:hypothetical protein